MPQRTAGQGRTGRPPVTSRAEILSAARRLIDGDGWEKLTMRRLATELGIGATTLYHHVQDREDLLIQLLNEHADQMIVPGPSGEPRERIVAATIAIHDALGRWPWAADVLTTDGFLGRLGPSALRMVEAVVAAAVEAGCTPEQAAGIFRDLWYYAVGEILVRANSARRRADGSAPAIQNGFFAGLEPSEMPQLAAIGERWPALAARDTFADGVRAFVDGLLAAAS